LGTTDAGTLNITIALMGADEFDSQVQTVTSDLNQIQDAANQASGTAGLGGLGAASTTAGSNMSGLQTSAGSLATGIGALGGAVSATVGGYINFQQSSITVETAQDRLSRAVTNNEKATNTYNDMLKKYGPSADSAGKSTKELADAQDKLGKSNETVQKDLDTITKDENHLADLRAKGKTNTTEYADALRKLSEDTNKLHDDQTKAATAQDNLTKAHTDFATNAAPKSAEGADKIKAAYDHMKDTQETVTRDQKELNQALMQQGLSVAQTVIGGLGSVSAAIGTFGRLFKETKTTVDEFGNSATSVGTNWGKLAAVGGPLALAGIAIGLIATNTGGVRTAMEKWSDQITRGNPLLRSFGELIHGIAADLGLTGQGIGAGQDEITKAIHDIHEALTSTNIGADLENLSKAFMDFLKDPFGSSVTSRYVYSSKPDTFFAPGIGRNITSLAPNAVEQFSTSSNAAILGQSILNLLNDAFKWLSTQAPKQSNQAGDAIVAFIKSSLKPGGPGDQLGKTIVDALSDYFQGKRDTEAQRTLAGSLIGNLGAALIANAKGNTENTLKVGAAILSAFFDFPKSLTSQEIESKRKEMIANIGAFLFDPKSWDPIGPQAWGAITSALKLTGGAVGGAAGAVGTAAKDVVEKIFGPLFKVENWTGLGKDAISALTSLFAPSGAVATGATAAAGITKDVVTKIFGPLFKVENWAGLGKDAIAALTSLFAPTGAAAGAAGTVAGITKDVVTKIFGPLFKTENWAGLGKDAIAALTSLFAPGGAVGGAAGTVAGITKDVVTKIFGPLFKVENWAGLATDAIKALESVYAAGAKGVGITADVVGKIFAPFFDAKNWKQFSKQAIDALSSFDWINLDSFKKIFGPLFDGKNWKAIGDAIGKALEGVLVTALLDFVQGIRAVAGPFGAALDPIIKSLQATQKSLTTPVGTATGATLPTGQALVSSRAGLSTGTIVVNLVVSGKQLAQVMAPFDQGTSQF